MRIFRFEVPVDDQWHTFELSSDPLSVGCRNPHVVEFWVLEPGQITRPRRFTVVGTGQPLPGEMDRHWGTAFAPPAYLMGSAFAPDPSLVWHLIEGRRP